MVKYLILWHAEVSQFSTYNVKNTEGASSSVVRNTHDLQWI